MITLSIDTLIVMLCMACVLGGFAGYRMGRGDKGRERRKVDCFRAIGGENVMPPGPPPPPPPAPPPKNVTTIVIEHKNRR